MKIVFKSPYFILTNKTMQVTVKRRLYAVVDHRGEVLYRPQDFTYPTEEERKQAHEKA